MTRSIDDLRALTTGTAYKVTVSRKPKNVWQQSVGEVQLYGPSAAHPGETYAITSAVMFDGDVIADSDFEDMRKYVHPAA